MKILQVISYFARERGGDVNVCYNYSKKLTEFGHDVTIITTNYGFDKEYASSIEKLGVDVVPLNCVFHATSFFYSPSIKKWAKNNVKNFDVIHMHSPRSYQNNIIQFYAKKYDIPYIIQTHGSLFPYQQKKFFKKVYDNLYGYKILRNACKLLALTKTEKEYYNKINYPSSKVCILPNGLNFSEYENLPEKGNFKKRYSINNDEKIILYLGRVTKTKGLSLLLKAFKELNTDFDNLKLVITGPDDGFLNELNNIIKKFKIENTIITGPLYGNNKLSAFKDADVFVTPTFSGFPVTFLEACACKTPIVTTNKVDELEWIENNVGYVTDYDINSFKNGIYDILIDNHLSQKFGKKGRNLIKNEFNINEIVKNLEKIYESCI